MPVLDTLQILQLQSHLQVAVRKRQRRPPSAAAPITERCGCSLPWPKRKLERAPWRRWRSRHLSLATPLPEVLGYSVRIQQLDRCRTLIIFTLGETMRIVAVK